jgi:protein-S-isoprenylcysteine O-methyltransferase Ste14
VPGNVKRILKSGISVPLMLGSYCAGAGRLDLWPGFAYAGFILAGGLSAVWLMSTASPELLKERSSMHAGTKKWDIPLAFWIALGGPLSTCVVAGLDARFHGVRAVDWRVFAGYLLGLAGVGIMLAAMAANRFFSTVVRIQTDRGHSVVDTGPYAFVRHPGYVGMLLTTIGTPLMLASTWAWWPCAITVAVVLVRTALEDGTLRRELPGYEVFTTQTCSRLIPGIW